jgi:hypothetical protein
LSRLSTIGHALAILGAVLFVVGWIADGLDSTLSLVGIGVGLVAEVGVKLGSAGARPDDLA